MSTCPDIVSTIKDLCKKKKIDLEKLWGIDKSNVSRKTNDTIRYKEICLAAEELGMSIKELFEFADGDKEKQASIVQNFNAKKIGVGAYNATSPSADTVNKLATTMKRQARIIESQTNIIYNLTKKLGERKIINTK